MPPTIDLQQQSEKWLPELSDDQLAQLITTTQKKMDDNALRLSLLRAVQASRAAVAAAAPPAATPTP